LLEILGSITSGLATPLKEEHQVFFRRVLIPLHKVKELSSFNSQLQTCVKNYLEKMPALAVDLIKGMLRYWPITSPGKEVIFINEIEEVLDLTISQPEVKFAEFGPELLRKVVQTSQGMHYQAAEKSLLFLNSDVLKRLVSQNMEKCFPIVVKGFAQAQKTPHWNQTVVTITFQVVRSYMELNKAKFEQLSSSGTNEEKQRKQKQADSKAKWDALCRKHKIEEPVSQFPLVQYKPPEDWFDQ
jgi:serine/threonine-protein phosphatase 2A regulatory subunit B'